MPRGRTAGAACFRVRRSRCRRQASGTPGRRAGAITAGPRPGQRGRDHKHQPQADPQPGHPGFLRRRGAGRILVGLGQRGHRLFVGFGQALLYRGQLAVFELDQLLLLALQLLQVGQPRLEFLDFGIAGGQRFPGFLQFLSQHLALATGGDAGSCSCLLAAFGGGRRNFQARVGQGRCRRCLAAFAVRPCFRGGNGPGGISRVNGGLRLRAGHLAPARNLAAHLRGRLGHRQLPRLAGVGHAQHRALAQQVDVAADERLRIGAHQRQHHLVDRDAVVPGHPLDDPAQGIACLDRAVLAGNRRGGGGGHWLRRSGRSGCRRGFRLGRDRVARFGDGRRGRLGIRLDRGLGCRRLRRRGDRRWRGRRPDDAIAGVHHGRLDRRLRRRGDGVRRVNQRGVFPDQPPLPPVGLDQEGQQRLLDRRGAGDPDHRAPGGVQGDVELQVLDQPLRRLQADTGKGLGRGQARLQLAQLGRIAGDDRDLGQQRLAVLRAHLDLAQAQGERRPRQQRQRHDPGQSPSQQHRLPPFRATTLAACGAYPQCFRRIVRRVPRPAPRSGLRPCGCCRPRSTDPARADGTGLRGCGRRTRHHCPRRG